MGNQNSSTPKQMIAEPQTSAASSSSSHSENVVEKFYSAIQQNKLKEVQQCIRAQRTLITSTDSNGSTPLTVATSFGHVPIVKYLLSIHPSLLDRSNSFGFTPIMLASSLGMGELVNFFINAKAKLDNESNHKTALMLAAERGNLPILKLLIEGGANIDAIDSTKYPLKSVMHPDPNGLNALTYAVTNARDDVVEYLSFAGSEFQRDKWTIYYGRKVLIEQALEAGNLKRAAYVTAILDTFNGSVQIPKALVNIIVGYYLSMTDLQKSTTETNNNTEDYVPERVANDCDAEIFCEEEVGWQ